MQNNKVQKELMLKDLLNILKRYKWSILFITLIFTAFSFVYVYFKTPVYASYSIIKVKANQKTQSDDIINNNTASLAGTKDVLEEISLLKTFRINDTSLDVVNFKVQYYEDEEYKKVEIFGKNLPIMIDDITIHNKDIIGKIITLTPHEYGYTLSYKVPYKNKIKKSIFNIESFNFKELSSQYNVLTTNNYFSLKINEKFKFSYPIHFVLNGVKRDIFEQLIHSKLSVNQLERDTSLIKISFEDTIPERANQYVNALTKSFIDYSIESKSSHNNKTLNFITKELENIKKELKESEKQLESHQVSTNIVNPTDQGNLYIKKLANIEIEISENELKKKLIKNLISYVKENYNLNTIAPSIAKLEDQPTLNLISKLQENQSKEEELQLVYTDEYPELKTVKLQIGKIRAQIEYNLRSLSTNIDYENTNLVQRRVSYESDMKELPSKERELVNIKRNYEVKSKMYEYLLKKQAENNIIQLSTFSDYQIIDDAYSSNISIKPKKSLIIATGIIIGFLLGSILALMRSMKNSYIKNKEDIKDMTHLPFYGSIPYYKQAKNKISINKELKSPFTEAFRTLRTNLQFLTQKDKGTVLLITSTIPGEGKSTNAANLATILEMAKYKTIIVNFDLRKPTLHKFFDVSNEQGVSTFLAGRDSLDDVITSTEFANLDIIPSGSIPSNPSELMLTKELPNLFSELKKRYEYIIIDTAPIGIISDTKTLMTYSDLNLIIIREDYAKKDFIHTLEEMIEKHDFKNIGLILNASKATGGEYGYGYSYEYK